MKHPAEPAIDVITAWYLALRDPSIVPSAPGTGGIAPDSGAEMRDGGVTEGENFYRPDKYKTSTGRYPPGMTGTVL